MLLPILMRAPPLATPRNLQNSPFRCQSRNQRERALRAQPSGGSGISFEAVPGPTQFKLRTPEVHLRQFRIRTLAIWRQ
eukprot:2589620-Alexandrium_andersonii.AAC.1